MHVYKVIAGAATIIYGMMYLTMAIYSYVDYLQCLAFDWSNILSFTGCDNSYFVYFVLAAAVIGAGSLIIAFGLKSISLVSLSKTK